MPGVQHTPWRQSLKDMPVLYLAGSPPRHPLPTYPALPCPWYHATVSNTSFIDVSGLWHITCPSPFSSHPKLSAPQELGISPVLFIDRSKHLEQNLAPGWDPTNICKMYVSQAGERLSKLDNRRKKKKNTKEYPDRLLYIKI